MQIPADRQDTIYEKYWQPMQDLLSHDLEVFFRHYLTKNGTEVKQNEVYLEIKKRFKNNSIEYLKNISSFSEYYSRLLDPKRETNKTISKYLDRLKRLEITTVYPFLLNCYEDWQTKKIKEEDFITILKTIENFLLRRFVCNISTQSLNKIFVPLHTQIVKNMENGGNNFVETLKLLLQNKEYPKDENFRNRLVDVKLYGSSRSEKCKLILESIEEYFGHKEEVSFENLSIEHIMPQNLDDRWKKHLGEDWAITHDLMQHTLGNLTLTAYNSELSNSTFDRKQEYYKKSNLRLNKYFEFQTSWQQEDIEKRADYFADLVLKIWKYFGNEAIEPSQPNSLKYTVPKKLDLFGKKYTVKSWRDVLEVTLNTLLDDEPDSFKDIMQQFPRLIGWDEKYFRSTRKLKNGAFIETNLSSQDIYRFCLKAIETVELSIDEWHVEYQASKRTTSH